VETDTPQATIPDGGGKSVLIIVLASGDATQVRLPEIK